jgi:hypothetical protein
MQTIKIKINYNGDVKINNEYTASAPLEMLWFPDNDLTVETKYEKIVSNTDKDTEITLRTPDKKLEPVKTEKLEIVKNNLAHYVIVNNKYAFKLPSNIFD